MQIKKTRLPYSKNNFVRNLVGFVLYENALIFPKLLKKSKKHNFFSQKVRYLKARIVTNNFFGFKKRSYTFSAHLLNAKKKIIPKTQAIYRLFLLALKVRSLGKQIFKNFDSKFVGNEARFLVKQYLNTYIAMYKFWYENEKWGFFDEDLTEKTKLKLMKYFWLNKPRRFLRAKIWKRAYPLDNFSFRYVKKFGYNMKSLKVTDQLFFWHAFTRKKLKQTLWIFRTSQIYKKILCLKKKSKKFSIFKSFYENKNFLKIYSFFLKLNIMFFSAKCSFSDFTLKFKNVSSKLKNLMHVFFYLKTYKNDSFVLMFLFSRFLKNYKSNFLKNYVLIFVLKFFFSVDLNLKKRILLYTPTNLCLFSLFAKTTFKNHDNFY